MRVLCVLLSILLSPLAWADSLVIRGVTVIDATGKPAQPDMTVVIEEDQVSVVGPAKKVKAPAGSQIIDGRGKFLTCRGPTGPSAIRGYPASWWWPALRC